MTRSFLRHLPIFCAMFFSLLPLTLREASAGSAPFCHSLPRLYWLSSEEVDSRVRELGFRLVRIRMADDRCYAVQARHIDGRVLDLIMHPVSAQIIRGL